MSRPARWMPQDSAGCAISCGRSSPPAGGIIVAATHASLGIDGAQELLLDQLSPAFAQATAPFTDGEALGQP